LHNNIERLRVAVAENRTASDDNVGSVLACLLDRRSELGANIRSRYRK
jgi:hypothetical protein